MTRDLVRHLSRLDLSEAAVMTIPLSEARASMVPFRVAQGFAAIPVRTLLTEPSDNLKLSHSSHDMVAAYGLSLAPADMSGWNVCRYATQGCRAACLATAGNGRYGSTQRGRVWRTLWLAERPQHFLRFLVHCIDSLPVDKWEAAGWSVSMRLNVLADLPWETLAPWVAQRLQSRGVAMVDYTKWPTARRDRSVALSLGYTLADSVHEGHSEADVRSLPHPVVVFDVKRGAALPTSYLGRPVIDGDLSDARHLDPAGCVVGLRYKEVQTTKRAAAVASGFVRSAA